MDVAGAASAMGLRSPAPPNTATAAGRIKMVRIFMASFGSTVHGDVLPEPAPQAEYTGAQLKLV
ncbi:hypothetical protein RN2511_021160 [Rhodococcus sp. NKCM2511]|nr:hypothetical protein RN2511_021160 [Rhodococcus sp. NKCM2511]